jgi:hypothetical protein
MAASIAGSGVRIVGDLDSLRGVPTGAVDQADVRVTPEVAAAAMMGVLLASGVARGAGSGQGVPGHEPPELFRVSTTQLGVALLRRVPTAIRGRLSRLRRRD